MFTYNIYRLFFTISLAYGCIGALASDLDEGDTKAPLPATVAYDHSGTSNVSSGDSLEYTNEDYEDNENEGDLSTSEGSFSREADIIRVQPVVKPEDKGKPKRKGKGKRKNKSKGEKNDKSTREKERQEKEKDTTPDPCATTHLDYCIHGHCKYMEELKEATCICLKGYDGERCGIQLLKTKKEEEMKPTDITQMVLVIIAVVLSLISFTAILLIICAHYRTHKNFIANYLGTSSEKEKLRQDGAHIVV